MAYQNSSQRTYRDVVEYGKPSSGSFVAAHGTPSSGSTNGQTMEQMIKKNSNPSSGGEVPWSFEEWASSTIQKFQAWAKTQTEKRTK